jgi:hypothetical protein
LQRACHNVSALLQQVRQVAEGIGDPGYKASALRVIAEAVVKMGSLRLAREIAEKNTSDQGRVETLATILRAWAELKNAGLAQNN